MKKIIALLLALVMIAGLAVGCSPADDEVAAPENNVEAPTNNDPVQEEIPEAKEPVNLTWYTRGPGMQVDTKKVNEAFNELLHTYEGFEHLSIEFVPYTGDDYAQAVDLAYADKKQVDILCTVGLNFVDLARDGYLVALDDMLEAHPTLKNEFPEWLWNTQYVDDGIYTVPNYQRGSNPTLFMIPAEYADCIDWEAFSAAVKRVDGAPAKSITEICAMLEDYLLKVREKTGRNDLYLYPPQRIEFVLWENIEGGGYDANTSIGNNPLSSDLALQSVYTTDWFKESWKIACDWYDKGYFPADALTNQNAYSFANGDYVIQFGSTTTLEEDGAKELLAQTNGFDCEVAYTADFAYMTNSWGACGNGISATCEHPEDALAFLELINTDAGVELYNMLVYGLEGEHYTKNDDGSIKTLHYDSTQAGSDAPYSAHHWCVGNSFKLWLNQAWHPKTNEWALVINEEAMGCPWTGMRVDTRDVDVVKSNMKALTSEWLMRIRFGIDGVDGFEDAYNTFMDAINAAGINDAVDVLQTQLDDYLASRQ